MLLLTQRTEFTGALIGSELESVSTNRAISGNLPPLSGASVTTLNHRLSMIGHMATCTLVVQYCRLCLHLLQMWLKLVYHPNCYPLTIMVQRPPLILVDNSGKAFLGIPFSWPSPTSNSCRCLLNRGPHLDLLEIQGLWSKHEVSLHISVLELCTICNACQTFQDPIRGSHTP